MIDVNTPAQRLADDRPDVADEQRIWVASQWQLMWWRFCKHRLALVGAAVVVLFYLIAIFADFLAYADPNASAADRGLMPPQPIRFRDEATGEWRAHVYAISGKRDPLTFRRLYTPDPEQKVHVVFFAEGYEYKLLGLIPSRTHLLGVEGVPNEEALFILGTDLQGRDLWSRLVLATRISMTIGLCGVAISLVLGILIGGISGYYGGFLDTAIQRVIELITAIPTIPLWMSLAAALPPSWSVVQVYFAVTIIISLVGWTGLARVVRGRFLSLREEEYVMAAKLSGSSQMRIILRHMVPGFLSHLITSVTLNIPGMIISETSLSFLGLGLRPPAISWGVLMQQAQNVQTLALSPWLLAPVVPVFVAILSFNFMGDGLRDAADPYQV